MKKIIFLFLCFGSFAGYAFAGIDISAGAFCDSGIAAENTVGSSNSKLFGLTGQSGIGVVVSGNDELRGGFYYVVRDTIMFVAGSIPYVTSLTVENESGATINESMPTSCANPVFQWETAYSTSPVTGYSYSLMHDGITILADVQTKSVIIDSITLTEIGTYLFSVKAVNESGNWGPSKSFTYIFDNSGPKPLGIVDLETELKNTYVHPLTMMLAFEFNEDLDGVTQNSLTLVRKKWNGESESVAGEVKYSTSTKVLEFIPAQPLKALSAYILSFNKVADLAGNTFSDDITFNTYLGKAMEAEIYSSDGQVKLTIPSWAVENEQSIVTLEKVAEDEEIISKANRKVELRNNMKLAPSGVFKLHICDLNNNEITQFSKNVNLSFNIPDTQNDGLWDDTDVRLKDISMAVLDSEKKDWMIQSELSSLTNAGSIEKSSTATSLIFSIKSPGTVRLVSYLAPTDNVGNVLIYPVPFKPSAGHAEITFLRLPADAEIKIYNIAGELVKEFQKPDQGQLVWDVKNNYGEELASGVYLAMIKSNGSKKIYKIAVQR